MHDEANDIGGAENIVYATLKILNENGHTARLYAPSTEGLFSNPIFNIKHYRSMRSLIRKFQPDIMHVHGIYRKVSPAVLVAAKQLGLPIVMTLHDFQIVCPKSSLVDESGQNCQQGFAPGCFGSSCFPRKPLNRAYQFLKGLKLAVHRFIIRRTVSHFFSPSVCLMNWVVTNFGVKNISLLPNFIQSDRELSLNSRPDGALLFIGQLNEQKGVDVLIRAAAKVRTIVPGIRLKIVGDGPDEKKLRDLADDLHVSRHVEFSGRLSNDDVMKEYDAASCVVIPSRFAENCSMVGVEALSKGKIIIASRIGGLPDLVDEQETGFLVQANDPDDLADAILHLLQNPSLLSTMGGPARAKYERSFSKPAYTAALLASYDRIIRGAA